jgi:hypothetical protein
MSCDQTGAKVTNFNSGSGKKQQQKVSNGINHAKFEQGVAQAADLMTIGARENIPQKGNFEPSSLSKKGSVNLGGIAAASTIAIPLEGSSILGLGLRALSSLAGMSTLLTSSSYENPDDFITVYRGSNLTTELQIHAETGVVMSGAAQDKYMEITNMRLYESGSLASQDYISAVGQAGVYAVKRHAELVAKYGGEGNLAEQQTLLGDRFPDKPRSMFSVTTDIDRARYFARGGTVFSASVNKNKLIQTPVESSTEQEYFIRAQIRMERVE